jgi:hypothetical protein
LASGNCLFDNRWIILFEYDNIASTTIKAHRTGFHDCIYTEDIFKRFSPTSRKTHSGHPRQLGKHEQ